MTHISQASTTRMAVVAVIVILMMMMVISLVSANDHVIHSLPGYDKPIPFRQYGGYLQSNATNGRHLYYWFIESERDPANDPVVLWMNGGPGCSSLTGLITEHGPFLINPDGKTLRENPYSWNKISNVLYLESPAGVGYSYSENPREDYTIIDDDKTADDVYNFLQEFFKRYPQFQKNDFYVSGESYAGHYVPTVSHRIFVGNEKGDGPVKIQLKGFLVGNGVTDMEQDSISTPYFMWQHLMIPGDLFSDALKACDFDFYRNGDKPGCARYLNKMWSLIDGVNPYGIYADCEYPPETLALSPIKIRGKKHNLHPLLSMFALNRGKIGALATAKQAQMKPSVSAPCINDAPFSNYFNMREVKTAINARQDILWEFCSDIINRNYDWTRESMLPFYEVLLKAGMRILSFTGDTDLAVNPIGTQYSIMKMNMTTTGEFRNWSVEGSRQVAGRVRNYGPQLTFVTVRGAGHMVPTDKPVEALYMYQRFLENKPF